MCISALQAIQLLLDTFDPRVKNIVRLRHGLEVPPAEMRHLTDEDGVVKLQVRALCQHLHTRLLVLLGIMPVHHTLMLPTTCTIHDALPFACYILQGVALLEGLSKEGIRQKERQALAELRQGWRKDMLDSLLLGESA
jgi:hypothetical protein